MNNKLPQIILVLTLAWIFMPVADAVAQSGGFTGSFSRIGFSARGMSMGNAMTAVDQEGTYGYYNPALSARPATTAQIDLSSSAMQFDRQLHMLNTHFQLPPSAGISISLINARISDIDGRTQSGYQTDQFSVSEYQFNTNFALRFTESIWGGIGIKYNLSSYHSEVPNSSAVALDVGLRYGVTEDITVGVVLHDLFASNQIDTSELYGSPTSMAVEYSYPTRLKMGFAYDGFDKLLIASDYEIQFQTSEISERQTELVEGRPINRQVRSEVRSNSHHLRLGARYFLHERITLRSGVQTLDLNSEYSIQPTAGFSLHLPFDRYSPAIDYAFFREPSGISTMHVFSIRLNI